MQLSIPTDEIASKVATLVVDRVLEKISELKPEPTTPLIQTRNESAKFVRLSLPTFDKAVKAKEIPVYYPSPDRKVFLTEDLIAFVKRKRAI